MLAYTHILDTHRLLVVRRMCSKQQASGVAQEGHACSSASHLASATYPAALIHKVVNMLPHAISLAVVLIILSTSKYTSITAHELIKFVFVLASTILCLRGWPRRFAVVWCSHVHVHETEKTQIRTDMCLQNADSACGAALSGSGVGLLTAPSPPGPARAGPMSERVVKPLAPRPSPGT